jgi:membrane peptidoglycan carboxypeptidase
MATPGPASILIAVRRLLLVAGVSALAGLLVAGLALPVAATLGLVARESANGFSELPADLDTDTPLPERSRILDADGNLIATFYTENRVSRELDRIAPVMQDAVLAIEDHRFYGHGPIDFQGTMRAFMTNVETGDIAAGGSTLTQQYAKLLTVAQAETEEEQRAALEESYLRKLRELRLAVGLEQQLTKDEILEGYLNIAYYGAGAHGVEAAARRYFSTSAADLTLPQAALLAGIIQQPVAYDPTRNPERAQARRDVVLRRMADLEFITTDELNEALATDLELDERVTRNGCDDSVAEFFCEYAVQEVLRLEELGETRDDRLAALYRGGLTIRTTLDRDAQRAAQRAIADRVAPTDTAAAALASVEPGTGEIKALAQSRGYGTDEGETTLNLAVDKEMGGGDGAQPGSAFKVWWLAAAIEQGIALNMTIQSPYQVHLPQNSFDTCEGPYPVSADWSPRNYSTSLSGLFDLRTGTERSVNTFYAQLAQQTGLCDPIRIASQAGLTRATGESLSEIPANVLGTDEVSPLSMAEAYAMFAARGVHCDSYAVTQVTDRHGEDLFAAEPNCNRVMAEGHADGVNDVLKGVVNRGTGTRMQLDDGRDVAGKTGTTNSAIAVWWVGFIPQLSTAVAVFDPAGSLDPETNRPRSLHGLSYNGEVINDACGGCIPGPIWKQMMDSIAGDYERLSFDEPDPTVVAGALADVPDVRGRSVADATSVLEDAGFRAHVADEVPSQLPVGTVVNTQPGPGSSYPSGATVGLIVSSGPPPDDDDDDDNDNGNGNGPGNGDGNGGGGPPGDDDDGPPGGDGPPGLDNPPPGGDEGEDD